MCGHAAALPPGISDGPVSAPSSPPDTQHARCFDLPGAADRVGEQAVAAVDQDIARIEQRQQLIDHGVDRRTSLDEHQDLARPL
jgi:hypothetical protein